jgi:hypothetical protein
MHQRLLFLYWTLFHYMFRPKWPSSGVQVIVVPDSSAHYNAVFFPPIVIASRYLFGYVGCTENQKQPLATHISENSDRRKENRITVSSRVRNCRMQQDAEI